jgi:hypothetical protein
VWVTEEAKESWLYGGERVAGGKKIYSDGEIQLMWVLKEVYRLTNRKVVGFVRSILALMKWDLPVPSHTPISRRGRELKVDLRVQPLVKGAGLTVIMDSTGLKVYGEGEWHKNKHGEERPTRWKKLHITFDPNSGQILSAVLTDQDVDDGDREQVIEPSLAHIPEPIDRFVADGAYDKTAVYEAVQAHTPSVTFVVPPRRNAVYWDPPRHTPNTHYTHQRNLNQHTIALTDKQTWAALVGYHQRSNVLELRPKWVASKGCSPQVFLLVVLLTV